MTDEKRGLYRKYEVRRTDGSAKHESCEYFVLDLDHDPFARTALLAYATACWSTHPKLAQDLRRVVIDRVILKPCATDTVDVVDGEGPGPGIPKICPHGELPGKCTQCGTCY